MQEVVFVLGNSQRNINIYKMYIETPTPKDRAALLCAGWALPSPWPVCSFPTGAQDRPGQASCGFRFFLPPQRLWLTLC